MAARWQPKGPPLQNRGNKARMSMKTKRKDKKSPKTAGAVSQALDGRPGATTRVAPAKSREQSENVYENKGYGQKVTESCRGGRCGRPRAIRQPTDCPYKTREQKELGAYELSTVAWSLAERVGFEPTCPLLAGKTLSRRPRYDRFGTSPARDWGLGIRDSGWGLGAGGLRLLVPPPA